MRLDNLDQLGVSVVICCYNGQHRIQATLTRLLNQESINFPWEVLLVDNASEDNTVNVAKSTWKEAATAPCQLRVIIEQKRGTMFARSTGIARAKFRYLLFCDDDNWFSPAYVATAYSIISKDSGIAAVGGLGTIVTDEKVCVPEWIEKFKKSYGAGPQGPADGDTTFNKGCLYTAGAIIDRVWLNKLYSLGFQSSLKGRDGKSLVAGEDTELTYALKLIGGKLYYSSLMQFEHFMPPNRLTWSYLKRLWRSFGYSDFLISPYRAATKKLKKKHAWRMVGEQALLAMRYRIISMFADEGNVNILKYNKAVGALHAARKDRQVFMNNLMMVKRLSTKSDGRAV